MARSSEDHIKMMTKTQASQPSIISALFQSIIYGAGKQEQTFSVEIWTYIII